MSALLHRHITRPKTALFNFPGLLQSLMRWLSLPRRPAGERSLQLLETISLSADASIALVRFEREILAVGVTPQNMTVLVRREPASASGEARANTGATLP
jgi:flagellar biogenesis protein FliO